MSDPVTVNLHRHQPITVELDGDVSRLGELDVAALNDWKVALAARVVAGIEPRIRPRGPSKEVERDADGRIARVVEFGADPPASVMARQVAAEVVAQVVDRALSQYLADTLEEDAS